MPKKQTDYYKSNTCCSWLLVIYVVIGTLGLAVVWYLFSLIFPTTLPEVILDVFSRLAS